MVALAFCTGLTGLCAHAAEKTQDGIKLCISSDKTAYDENDNIVAKISLENNSEGDIIDIALKGIVPENYHLAEGSGSVLRSTYLPSGKNIDTELVFVPDKAEDTVSETETSKTNITSIITSETAVSTSVTEKIISDIDSDDSDGIFYKIIIAGGLLLVSGAVFIVLKKKGPGKKALILLCVTAAGSFNCSHTVVFAEEEKNISVSETVTVGGKELELTATVNFTVDEPDMAASADEYYKENSEEVISVEEIEKTEDIFTEKEVIEFLAQRGFSYYPVTYDYNMDGTFVDEAEASADSNEKHPMYQTYYVSDKHDVWTIFVIGRSIAANPASYNLESDLDAQVLVSETETLTSYTEMGNKLYTTIPKESAVILKTVDKITSQTLNELTFEEVIKK